MTSSLEPDHFYTQIMVAQKKKKKTLHYVIHMRLLCPLIAVNYAKGL